jgi:hypothetical protein
MSHWHLAEIMYLLYFLLLNFLFVLLGQGLTMQPRLALNSMILLPQTPKCWDYRYSYTPG